MFHVPRFHVPRSDTRHYLSLPHNPMTDNILMRNCGVYCRGVRSSVQLNVTQRSRASARMITRKRIPGATRRSTGGIQTRSTFPAPDRGDIEATRRRKPEAYSCTSRICDAAGNEESALDMEPEIKTPWLGARGKGGYYEKLVEVNFVS